MAFTRNGIAFLAAGMALLVLAGPLRAQTSSPQEAQTVAKNSPPSPASPGSSASTSASPAPPSSARPTAAGATSTEFIQPEQPMTLGELARRERARRSSQPKAVKIFDDENM
ncbi:MAG: hypothetical protein WAN14_19430, partial [Candidatus Acidiferrales bacterium]